jgi:hypothetical protein
MKQNQILLAFVFFMFISISGFSEVTDPALTGVTRTESATDRVAELESRLYEIKAMDIKSLSRAERKAVRKEVNAVEKEMKAMDHGGVYISVGGIIIIILLLILLL